MLSPITPAISTERMAGPPNASTAEPLRTMVSAVRRYKPDVVLPAISALLATHAI
jgi:hypothetical protein